MSRSNLAPRFKSSFPLHSASNTVFSALSNSDNPQDQAPEVLPPGEILPPQGSAPPPRVPPVREDLPFSLLDVLRIAVIAFIGLMIFGGLSLSIAAHIRQVSPRDPSLIRDPRIAVPAQSLAYVFVLMFMVVLVHTRGRPFWQGVRWKWPAAWTRFAIIGVALQIAIQVFERLLPIPKQLPIDQYFTTTGGAYLMAVVGTTFGPLMEELFFRGFLYPALARRVGVATSLVITALLFAGLHGAQLAYSWSPLLLLFIVGFVLTLIRAVTGSVAAGFLVHAFYNATVFGILYFVSDHFRNLQKLAS